MFVVAVVAWGEGAVERYCGGEAGVWRCYRQGVKTIGI